MQKEANKTAYIFWATAVFLLLIYTYFFLFLPQSWTLNNDYGQIRAWIPGSFNFWQELKLMVDGRLNDGRVLVVDAFLTALKFEFLPVTPLVFRLIQFLFLGGTLVAVYAVLKRFSATTLQMAFAAVLILSNFTMKEWIVLAAAAESFAAMFFFISLALYVWGKKAWSIPFFILAFLSKESFVVLAGVYAVLEFLSFRKTKRISWGFLATLVVCSLAFCIFVAQLPRAYTGGSHFSVFKIKEILVGLIVAPLKGFGLAILFTGIIFLLRRSKKLNSNNLALAFIGLAIIVPTSVFLSLWGPFDSWGYLQIIIPFGWAFLLAALIEPLPMQNRWVLPGAVVVCLFAILVTFRGSHQRWQFLSEAKLVAEMVCEDSKKYPGLQTFTNCEEGAVQLQNYLFISQKCSKVPAITYSRVGLPPNTKAPYSILIAPKWCNGNGAEFSDASSNQRYDLNLWTVLKNL